MRILIQEFLIVTIIVFSINMIYFYFKNKSKKYKNVPTVEMNYISKLYGIDISFIGFKKVQKDISIINSIIITIDLLTLYHTKSLVFGMILIIIITFLLIPIGYHILGKMYQRIVYR